VFLVSTVNTLHIVHWQNEHVFDNCLNQSYDASGAHCSKFVVQLLWRLCCWSWCMSKWSEAYQC